MPYRLKHSEPVPDALRRIVGEELTWAVKQLAKTNKREQGVHEARKSVKKIRGILRLVQSELGPVFHIENRRFRDIGRKLSALRDAASIIEAFDSLHEKHRASLKPGAFGSIRHSLLRSKRETEQSLDVAKTTALAISAFNQARQALPSWPLTAQGFSALETGLYDTYQNGRKLLNRAGKSNSPVVFHEFRKAVKTHWYHVRLLEGFGEHLEAREKSLKELETLLGDDHNLAVLQEKLENHPETAADREEFKLFAGLLSQESKELRAKALTLGAELYSAKPHVFIETLSGLWPAAHQHHQKPDRKEAGSASDPSPKSKAAVA